MQRAVKLGLGLLVLLAPAPAAFALQNEAPADTARFSCNVSFGSCTCDGSYENCKAMEENCKNHRVSCPMINGQRFCFCLMPGKYKSEN